MQLKLKVTPAALAQAFVRTVCASALMAAAVANGADWKPTANAVEIVIPSGAGAGLDTAGRMIKSLFDQGQLLSAGSVVINKPGAGGTVAYQYLNQYAGNGNYISLSSPGIVTNRLMGIGKIDYRDLTPISRLYSDNVVVIVKADSPLKDARDLMARLRRDPQSLSLGIATALGGANHIALASALKAGGVDVKNTLNVVYKSGANAVSDLLGGHVDVVPVAAPAAVSQLQSGRVRAIAVTSPQRLSGSLAGIPTWREQGIEASYTAWRVVVGPQGMSTGQISYWEGVFAKLATMPEWKTALERNYWIDEYLNNRDTKAFLEQQLAAHQAILGDLGLQK